MKKHAFWAASLWVALSACHTYVPAPSPPTPGSSIRTRLTAEGAVRMAQVTGHARTSVEGRVIRGDSDRILLEVPIPGVVPELQRSPKVTDTLTITTADITSMDQQSFSGVRTVLLVGGVMALVTTAIVVAESGGSTGPIGGGGEPTAFVPTARRVTVIRIPIGRR